MKCSCGKMKFLRKCMPCLRRMKKAGVPDPCCVPVTPKTPARIISIIQMVVAFIVLIIFSFVSLRTGFTNGIPEAEIPDFFLFLFGIIFYSVVSIFLLEFTTKKTLSKWMTWVTWVFMVLSVCSYIILHFVLYRILYQIIGYDSGPLIGLFVVIPDIFHVYAAWVVIAFMRALKKGVTEEVEYTGPIVKKAPSDSFFAQVPDPPVNDSENPQDQQENWGSSAEAIPTIPTDAPVTSSDLKISPTDDVEASTSSQPRTSNET